jgi:hypothetical protein
MFPGAFAVDEVLVSPSSPGRQESLRKSFGRIISLTALETYLGCLRIVPEATF